MQYEEIDPLGDDFIGTRGHDFLEISQFLRHQRWPSDSDSITDIRDHAVNHHQFSPRFAALTLAVNMYRIMFVGIEHDSQAEVFVKLGHFITLLCDLCASAQLHSGRPLTRTDAAARWSRSGPGRWR